MTKAEIKKAVCKEMNYWIRAYGDFAREDFEQKLKYKNDKILFMIHNTSYLWQARVCRLFINARNGILKRLAIN